MKVRDIKRRITRLMEKQVVRGPWLYSSLQMRRFMGECYPVRREKKREQFRKLYDGKIGTIYGMTATEIPNDLPEVQPIDPVAKHVLPMTQPNALSETLCGKQVYTVRVEEVDHSQIVHTSNKTQPAIVVGEGLRAKKDWQ